MEAIAINSEPPPYAKNSTFNQGAPECTFGMLNKYIMNIIVVKMSKTIATVLKKTAVPHSELIAHIKPINKEA